ncbi:MAG: hypothetical protein COB85_08025 [Bacteroidetes bacterium]|nr:MAG: hypothetical protein COB85_08025 [Bacteroidota bacterium]
MSVPETVDTDTSSISKFDEHIVEVKFKDGAHVKYRHARELGEATLEISGREKFLLLIDATDIFGIIDPEAMDYFTTNEELVKLRMAQAMVVNSLPIRLIANFYMRVKKPPGEVKIFANRKDALVWLSDHRHLVSSN